MSSTGCPVWVSVPRRCARRWSTDGCSPAPMPTSMARIPPRSATGRGRRNGTAGRMRTLVLNAGSRTLKASLVGMARRSPGPRSRASARVSAAVVAQLGDVGRLLMLWRTGSSMGASGSRRPCVADEAVVEALRGLVALAPLHMPPALGGPGCGPRAVPGRAPGVLLRHRVPRDAAGVGGPLPGAGDVVDRVGHPALRLPWPVRGVVACAGPRSCSGGQCRSCGWSSPTLAAAAP